MISMCLVSPLYRGLSRGEIAPLFRHRGGDTGVGAPTLLCAGRARAKAVLPARCLILPSPTGRPLEHVRRDQRRKPLQPQAGGLALGVSELPRLDDLVRLAPDRRHDAD